MIDETVINKTKDLLCKAAQPRKVILFGSHVSGGADDQSDIDLLIVEDTVQDRIAEMVRLSRVLSPLRVPFDVLVVSRAMFDYWANTPGNVYHQANTQGRILYEAA